MFSLDEVRWMGEWAGVALVAAMMLAWAVRLGFAVWKAGREF